MDREKATGEIPLSRTRQEVIKEAKRIEEATMFSAKGHFVAAEHWSRFHRNVGVPIAVLAALAAASSFSQFDASGVVAGFIALVVAGLSAFQTFMNPNEKASGHLNAGNNYDALQNRARIFWSIECWQTESDGMLTERLRDLSEHKDKLNRSCPQVPEWAYTKAREGIEAGETIYAVDSKPSGGEVQQVAGPVEDESTGSEPKGKS